MIYMITYDINNGALPEKHERLHAAIQELGPAHHCMSSMWFLNNPSLTARAIYKYMSSCLDVNDRIMVSAVHQNEYWGFLSGDSANWLEVNINN